MTIDDVKELAAEFGWVGTGADHDLARWLRDRLETADSGGDVCEDCGERCACDATCGDCAGLETELQATKDELNALKRACAELAAE